MTELAKRTFTILLLFSLIALLFSYGNNTAFYLTIYILSILSFYEWTHIKTKNNIPVMLFVIAMPLFFYLNFINTLYFSLAMLMGWALLIYSIFFIRNNARIFIKKHYISIGFLIFTSFFLLLIHLYPQNNTVTYNNLSDHKYYLLSLIILISSIDIFAYISGKLFGKNRIINNISPNKTFEGYAGGYAFTILLFVSLYNYNQIIWTYLDLLYLTIFILLSFFGDLFMSFIKRIYDIKDTGNILPGHGGILDRLDSYFPSIPLFYIWMLI